MIADVCEIPLVSRPLPDIVDGQLPLFGEDPENGLVKSCFPPCEDGNPRHFVVMFSSLLSENALKEWMWLAVKRETLSCEWCLDMSVFGYCPLLDPLMDSVLWTSS